MKIIRNVIIWFLILGIAYIVLIKLDETNTGYYIKTSRSIGMAIAIAKSLKSYINQEYTTASETTPPINPKQEQKQPDLETEIEQTIRQPTKTEQETVDIDKINSKRYWHGQTLLPKTTIHDQDHPTKYPQEWDAIQSSEKICWVHKASLKRVCEKKGEPSENAESQPAETTTQSNPSDNPNDWQKVESDDADCKINKKTFEIVCQKKSIEPEVIESREKKCWTDPKTSKRMCEERIIKEEDADGSRQRV